MRDGGCMNLPERDIEGWKGSLIDNCLRVDKKSTVILRFEQFIVVSIGVGSVIEEDDLQVPTQAVLFSQNEHAEVYLI